MTRKERVENLLKKTMTPEEWEAYQVSALRKEVIDAKTSIDSFIKGTEQKFELSAGSLRELSSVIENLESSVEEKISLSSKKGASLVAVVKKEIIQKIAEADQVILSAVSKDLTTARAEIDKIIEKIKKDIEELFWLRSTTGSNNVQAVLNVKSGGSLIANNVTTLNFVGATLVRNVDGSVTVTVTGGGGTPANPTKSIQFNNAGSFGGSANFLYDSVADTLTQGTPAHPYTVNVDNTGVVSMQTGSAIITMNPSGVVDLTAPNGGYLQNLNFQDEELIGDVLSIDFRAGIIYFFGTTTALYGNNGSGTQLEMISFNNTSDASFYQVIDFFNNPAPNTVGLTISTPTYTNPDYGSPVAETLIKTSNSQLVLSNGNDNYGTSKLILANHSGLNGFQLDVTGSSIAVGDFAFITNAGEANIRLETRGQFYSYDVSNEQIQIGAIGVGGPPVLYMDMSQANNNAAFGGRVAITMKGPNYALDIFDATSSGFDIGNSTTGDWHVDSSGNATFASITAGGLVTASSTTTFTNKRITKRIGSTTSSATPTINTDNVDVYKLTAQAVDITSFTTNLSGTPTDFQALIISITGTGTHNITWGTSFESSGTISLPTTGGISTTTSDIAFRWNTATSKWRIVGIS